MLHGDACAHMDNYPALTFPSTLAKIDDIPGRFYFLEPWYREFCLPEKSCMPGTLTRKRRTREVAPAC